jgi:uroporphyrinogen decarboxylase
MRIDASHMAQAIIKEIELAEAWRPAPNAVESFRQEADKLAVAAGEMLYINLAASISILPFGQVNLEQGIYAYADRPELVRRWNKAVNDQHLRYIKTVANGKLTPVSIIWDDIAAKNGLIYSPAMLEELFYPHLNELIRILHSRGVKALFHSDGDVTAALPRLIECGIDGFNPLETTAGMKVENFRDICGKQVVLAGGIDAVEVLARGAPQRVVQETRALIDLFRADGNLIVASASGEVDESMPIENVRAMYETVWNYGKY